MEARGVLHEKERRDEESKVRNVNSNGTLALRVCMYVTEGRLL